MKKLFFLVPIVALAMASCSNSEDAIQTSPVQKNAELKIFPQVTGSTRGVIQTTANISDFYLIANGKFGESATDNAATLTIKEYAMAVDKVEGAWTMATPLYWGDATTSASFAAFSPKSYSTKYENGKLVNFQPEAAPADQKDLVVAYNSGVKTAFSGGVPLHFQHALSQIVVKANYNKNTDDAYASFDDITVKVKGVKIVNVDNKGTLTLPTSSTVDSYTADWSLSGTANTTYSALFETPITLGSTSVEIDNSGANGPMLLLPQSQDATTDMSEDNPTGAYIVVSVDIDYAAAKEIDSKNRFDLYPAPADPSQAQTEGDGTFADIIVPVNIAWNAGYKYTYTLNFSNIAAGYQGAGDEKGEPVIAGILTPVTFLVTVESDWTEQNVTPAM